MTWKSDMQSLHNEAGGLMRLHVFRQVDAPELIGHAIAGDAEAVRLMRALNDALARINEAPRRYPLLCGSCPRPLRKTDFAVVLALPHRDDPSLCLSMGICKRCGTEPDVIEMKALDAFRRIWPDARPIAIPTPHGVGQA